MSNEGDLTGLQVAAVGFVDALLGGKRSGYFSSAPDSTHNKIHVEED